jgi:hypothetical protein
MHRIAASASLAALLLTGIAAAPQTAATPLPSPTVAPAGTPTTSPTPPPDPAITAKSKAFYHALAMGAVDRSQLSTTASKKFTAELMKKVATQIGPLGDPVTFEQISTGKQDGAILYAYLLTFGNGTKLDYIVGYDAQGKVSTIALSRTQ